MSKNTIKLSPKASIILAAATEAKVSAMNAQFVPSYTLEPGKVYILNLDMLLTEPSTAEIKVINRITNAPEVDLTTGFPKVNKVSFMETIIADITDPANITFHKISNGQLYNQFKIIETGKREFRLTNLRELANADVITPSLQCLVQALDQDKSMQITSTDLHECEIFGGGVKAMPFFEGELVATDPAIMKAFQAWNK